MATKSYAKTYRLQHKELGLCYSCPNKVYSSVTYCESCLVKRRHYHKRKALQLKKEVIDHYGGKCNCCGETIIEFLSIDHRNNDGAIHTKEVGGTGNIMYRWIKKNNFPKDRFQVLCFNCNCAKGFFGYCPHQIR